VRDDPPVATGQRTPDAAADALAALLAPYADSALPGRLVDVPPDVAARALDLLPPDLRTARLNLSQPPMAWLVATAAELGGRLVGALEPGRSFARLDGVQVDAALARPLAERVAAAWPESDAAPAALPAATAEAWNSWTAEWPIWSGLGTDLLRAPLPPDAAVLGLVWD
jgi:hypothetical protein